MEDELDLPTACNRDGCYCWTTKPDSRAQAEYSELFARYSIGPHRPTMREIIAKIDAIECANPQLVAMTESEATWIDRTGPCPYIVTVEFARGNRSWDLAEMIILLVTLRRGIAIIPTTYAASAYMSRWPALFALATTTHFDACDPITLECARLYIERYRYELRIYSHEYIFEYLDAGLAICKQRISQFAEAYLEIFPRELAIIIAEYTVYGTVSQVATTFTRDYPAMFADMWVSPITFASMCCHVALGSARICAETASYSELYIGAWPHCGCKCRAGDLDACWQYQEHVTAVVITEWYRQRGICPAEGPQLSAN